jgi:hypothetical protein
LRSVESAKRNGKSGRRLDAKRRMNSGGNERLLSLLKGNQSVLSDYEKKSI